LAGFPFLLNGGAGLTGRKGVEMRCEHDKIIETGQAEPSNRCMPPHAAHMEEWIEPIKCLVCGHTGSRFYVFSDVERESAKMRNHFNPAEEYPWDDGHEIKVEWDD
jgi:hypothetical protein